ncbi:MAG: nitroreductase family protein [Deltaproteobacteria bacterium]|nr:nitroreductase family protein [Deltaproteobacteria bacterium]
MDAQEVLNFFRRRRSVRRFQNKPLSQETLEILMKAAMAAPSGNNSQPWEFAVVQDSKVKEALSTVHPWVYMAKEAGAAIVVLGDKSSEWWEHDCAAATENLLLAAANLGLGAVWCGIKEHQEEAVRRILGAPSKLGVLCIIPIGHPAESPPPNTKYQKAKVHWDRFGKPGMLK